MCTISYFYCKVRIQYDTPVILRIRKLCGGARFEFILIPISYKVSMCIIIKTMLHMFSTQLYAFDKVDNAFGAWQGRQTGAQCSWPYKGCMYDECGEEYEW